MNSVNLIGNLATDVEIREVGEDKKVASFLLAVGRGGRDAGADFVGVSVWDRQAGLCAQDLSKGRRIGVEGCLRSRSRGGGGQRRGVVEGLGTRGGLLRGPRPEGEGEGGRTEG